LHGAVLTNPHDLHDLKEKLYQGIAMNRAEAESRLRELFSVVQHNDLRRWGEDFLGALAAMEGRPEEGAVPE